METDHWLSSLCAIANQWEVHIPSTFHSLLTNNFHPQRIAARNGRILVTGYTADRTSVEVIFVKQHDPQYTITVFPPVVIPRVDSCSLCEKSMPRITVLNGRPLCSHCLAAVLRKYVSQLQDDKKGANTQNNDGP